MFNDNHTKALRADKVSSYSLDPSSVARALGGKVTGRNRVLAPGPGHSHQDRSLSVKVDPAAPDGFLVTSFAGDDPMVCRDHVRLVLGLPAWSPASGRSDAPSRLTVIIPSRPDPDEERRAAWKRTRIAEIWHEARDPRGTLVERYLTQPKAQGGRGLVFPDDVAGTVLRFHPACPWRDESGQLIRVPAMVAAMRCIHTDRLKAVHRTRLTPDGKKADRRMYGDATESAIKLDPDEAVTTGLAVGEGIETVLAARQFGFKPAWALGSAGGIREFPVVNGIEGLTILEEHDQNGANAQAVEACWLRWHAAGREVLAGTPDYGKDMNDALHALNAPQGRAA
jgi:hypothetical protein